jgi:hypothetical protein
MRRLLLSLAVLLFPIVVTAQTPELITINTLSNNTGCITDAGGGLANGTVVIQATDGAGHAMPFRSTTGGNSYQAVGNAISRAITNGQMAPLQLQWVTGASNTKIPYTFTFVVNGHTTVYQNVDISPSGGATFDWCSANLMVNVINGPLTVKGDPGTVTANGVNGSFDVPGNLTVEGLVNFTNFTATNFNGTNGSVRNINGMLDVALMGTGGDIGAMANSAASLCTDAAPCHLWIPPGVYNPVTTGIVLPARANGTTFTCDKQATITYTGGGSFITTPVAVNGTVNLGGTVIDGGCKIIGTASGISGVHVRAGQGYAVRDVIVQGFSNGDGIWIDGANHVELFETSESLNLNGVRVNGNTCNGSNLCTWDRSTPSTWVATTRAGTSGYAPNAIHAVSNRMQNNLHWGVLENDIIGGSVSSAFGNYWLSNTIANNGTADQNSYGGFLSCFTTGTRIESTYFEAQKIGVVTGCVAGDPGVTIPTGYTAQFGGNNVNSIISHNFFNDSGNTTDPTTNAANNTTEIQLKHVISTSIDENTKIGTANCLVDGGAIGSISIYNNHVNTGTGIAVACLNGALNAGGLHNFLLWGDTSLNAMHFGGAVQVDDVISAAQRPLLATNFPTMTGGAQIVGVIGAITIWQAPGAPGGSCGGPLGMNIWFTPTNMYVCSGTWKLVGIS